LPLKFVLQQRQSGENTVSERVLLLQIKSCMVSAYLQLPLLSMVSDFNHWPILDTGLIRVSFDRSQAAVVSSGPRRWVPQQNPKYCTTNHRDIMFPNY